MFKDLPAEVTRGKPLGLVVNVYSVILRTVFAAGDQNYVPIFQC